MELENSIIYLIGIPAVGKYTVAREIGRLTGAKVVDNQLINTPIFSILGYDGTDALTTPGLTEQIRKVSGYCHPHFRKRFLLLIELLASEA